MSKRNKDKESFVLREQRRIQALFESKLSPQSKLINKTSLDYKTRIYYC